MGEGRICLEKYLGPIYWAAVGEKTTKLAAENADGVIFFLKPKDQISNYIDSINSTLLSLNKSEDEFNVISIVSVISTLSCRSDTITTHSQYPSGQKFPETLKKHL